MARGREVLLHLPIGNPERFEVDVPLEHGMARAAFARAEVFTPDAMITIVGEDGREDNWAPSDLPIYRGTIEGDPGSIVAARMVDGMIEMLIMSGDGEVTFVQPTPGARAGILGARTHVIYRDTDTLGHEGTCGVDDGLVAPEAIMTDSGDRMGPSPGPQVLVAELAVDADYEYFQFFGASTVAVAEDVAGLISMVNVVYERDAGVSHRISALIIRTSPNDPYTTTDSLALLNEMVAHWQSNETHVRRDIAHLFTGKDMDGSVLGRGWLSVVCSNSLGYAVSQAQFTTNMSLRIGLVAHELGHNWSANHCTSTATCQIMCSSLGGCDGLGAPGFVDSSARAIGKHAQDVSCLDSEVASCVGDADGNLVVDFRDVHTVLVNWGANYGAGTGIGDTDGDGQVNFEDIALVLNHWIEICS